MFDVRSSYLPLPRRRLLTLLVLPLALHSYLHYLAWIPTTTRETRATLYKYGMKNALEDRFCVRATPTITGGRRVLVCLESKPSRTNKVKVTKHIGGTLPQKALILVENRQIPNTFEL